MSALTGMLVLVACSNEPPPRSVQYFVDNRIVLDSVLLRCNADREATRADPECANARKAVARIAVEEEEEKRVKNEAAFERQRAVIRKRQEREADRIRAREEAEAARAAEALIGGPQPPAQSIPPPQPAAQPQPAPPQVTAAPTPTPALPPPQTPAQPRRQVSSATTPPAPAPQPPAQQPPAPAPQPAAAPPAATPLPPPPSPETGIEAEIKRLEEELKRRREAGGEPQDP